MPDAAVSYLDTDDPAAAAAAAKRADVVVIFAEQWRTESIDLESLSLPDGQDAVIAAVAAANPHTAVVLETGGAVLMPWRDKVGAIVEAWYPGERGGEAVARVLFGEIDAAGRLPITFPASEAQAPRPQIPGLANVKAAAAAQAAAPPKPKTGLTTVDITGGVQGFPVDYPEGADVGYRWYQRTEARPLYPFGYGLSYTHFTYSDLRVTSGATPRVSFTVRNDGARAGSDTPQLYGMAPAGESVRRLIGFEHVTLQPGQSRTVSLTVDPRLLARYDVQDDRWALDRKPIAIAVGRNVETMVLTGEMSLPAPAGR
jgi:beta-glucosidase